MKTKVIEVYTGPENWIYKEFKILVLPEYKNLINVTEIILPCRAWVRETGISDIIAIDGELRHKEGKLSRTKRDFDTSYYKEIDGIYVWCFTFLIGQPPLEKSGRTTTPEQLEEWGERSKKRIVKLLNQ